jgi:hypothetical protein
MYSKMMPSRGVTMLGAAIIRSGTPDLGFPLEKPKSNDESNIDDAFTKETTSEDVIIVFHDQRRGSAFTDAMSLEPVLS